MAKSPAMLDNVAVIALVFGLVAKLLADDADTDGAFDITCSFLPLELSEELSIVRSSSAAREEEEEEDDGDNNPREEWIFGAAATSADVDVAAFPLPFSLARRALIGEAMVAVAAEVERRTALANMASEPFSFPVPISVFAALL